MGQPQSIPQTSFPPLQPQPLQKPPSSSSSQPPPLIPPPPSVPGVQYYMCRTCITYIATIQDFVRKDLTMRSGIFRNAENVKIATPITNKSLPSEFALASVKCASCNSYLGRKFVPAGKFMLHWEKLLFWDGYIVLDPLTLLPFEPQPPLPSSSSVRPSSAPSSSSADAFNLDSTDDVMRLLTQLRQQTPPSPLSQPQPQQQPPPPPSPLSEPQQQQQTPPSSSSQPQPLQEPPPRPSPLSQPQHQQQSPPSPSSHPQPQQQPPLLPSSPPSPGGQYYMCSSCRVYITSTLDFIHINYNTGSAYFRKAVNVKLARQHRRTPNKGFVMSLLKCVNCNSLLGKTPVPVDYPSQDIRTGTLIFYWENLLFWDGHNMRKPFFGRLSEPASSSAQPSSAPSSSSQPS